MHSVNPQKRSHICSVIPSFLIADILEQDDISESTRRALNKTLNHTAKLQGFRVNRLPQNFLKLTEGDSDSNDTTPKKDTDTPELLNEPEEQPTPENPSEDVPRTPSPEEPVKKPTVFREIFDSKGTNKQRRALIFKEGDDTTSFEGDISAVQVHDYFGKSYTFFSEVFGRDSIDNEGHRLIASVHYDDDNRPPGMDNAFWDGDEMAFGDGDGEIFGSFTKNIDVIGHELSHGMVQYGPELEYELQSGALNESLADVFGIMIKQYFHPGGKQLAVDSDWLIGEGIFLPTLKNAASLRSMKAPGTAYNNPKIGKDRQPATMDKYAKLPNTSSGDWGGVHINSGIPNRVFYLVATELQGYSWDKAGKVWYSAMNDPTLRAIDTKKAFKTFADLTVEHALKLFDQDVADVITKAWKTVKVYRDDPPRAML